MLPTHFPGRDYISVIENPWMRKDVKWMQKFGLTHALYTEKVDLARITEEIETIDRLWPDGDWTVVDVSDGVTAKIYSRVEGYSESRIYNMGDENDSLEKIYLDGAKDIFIRNQITLNKKTHGVREIWLFKKNHPEVRVFYYGIRSVKLQYFYGLDGSVFNLRAFDGSRLLSAMDYTGKSHSIRQFDKPDSEFKTMLPTQDVTTLESIIMHAVARPIWYKNFYENKPQIQPDENIQEFLEKINSKTDNFYYVGARSVTVGLGAPWELLGDKWACNRCSLAYACCLYKEGSVCLMPSSEAQRLSLLFQSANAEDIIEGLSRVIGKQVDRLEEAVKWEDARFEDAKNRGLENPGHNNDVSKMINDVVRNGTVIAKLRDPRLGSALAVQINNNTGSVGSAPNMTENHKAIEAASNATPRERQDAVRAIEATGTSRSDITSEMITNYLIEQNGGVIQGEVIDGIRQDF